VVAFGLASGFLEPLESTNIHLFQIGVTRLVQLFPFMGITEAIINRYNEITQIEVERIRDFVIMHYKVTERDDSAFWRGRRDVEVPDSLADRLKLFAETAHVYQGPEEVFRIDSWVQVLLGQRLEPRSWHQLARMMSRDEMGAALNGLKANITRTVAAMPSHEAFLERYRQLDEAAS
jgi:tryptophan 7-halogenase